MHWFPFMQHIPVASHKGTSIFFRKDGHMKKLQKKFIMKNGAVTRDDWVVINLLNNNEIAEVKLFIAERVSVCVFL